MVLSHGFSTSWILAINIRLYLMNVQQILIVLTHCSIIKTLRWNNSKQFKQYIKDTVLIRAIRGFVDMFSG